MLSRSPYYVVLLLAVTFVGLFSLMTSSRADDGLVKDLKRIEAKSGGDIGVAILGSTLGPRWGYREKERFALNSTFKSFACAHLLRLADQGKASLDKTVLIKHTDLVPWSPVTKRRVGTEMSLAALCEAAVTMSDNSAANKILDAIGGPPALTTFMRSIGDAVTRMDRREPKMNSFKDGDDRDTTVPLAAITSLERLLQGDVLEPSSRDRLTRWMVDDQVADSLIRKVLPPGWRIADKSGAGRDGTRGIIAALWPPDHAPIHVAIYLKNGPKGLKAMNTIIAEVSEAIVKKLP